jgi:serine/threonine protein kinase
MYAEAEDKGAQTAKLVAGRYRLVKSLGKGSFGEVFEAEDIQFEPPRRVAVKILHDQYVSEANVREDLRREASTLARFSHPNILRVIDFGISAEMGYIVTDLAIGGSLANKLRPDPGGAAIQMPLTEVAAFLEQLADALDEAHSAGLLHRDIKPQNVLLDGRGRPLLADFGLATAVSASSSSMMVNTTPSGTPLYMAPEQWQGQAGRASDVYSLACVAFQMLTGQPPFLGSQYELMGQHMTAPVPRLSYRAPELRYPPGVDDVLAAALAKDPRQRTRPAREFARRFREALKAPATSVSDSNHAPYAVPAYSPPPWTPSPELQQAFQPGDHERERTIALPPNVNLQSQPRPEVMLPPRPNAPLAPMPPNQQQWGMMPPMNMPKPPQPYGNFQFHQPSPHNWQHPAGVVRITPEQRRRTFYQHLTSYCIIIGFLWLLYLLTTRGYPWPIWPMLGWGVGLSFHAVNTFLFPPMSNQNLPEIPPGTSGESPGDKPSLPPEQERPLRQ